MSTYIRWQGKVRETKTVVQILDLAHADSELDVDGDLRWATFCMDHGLFVTHPTSQLAWDHAAHPLGWCGGCNGSDTPESVVEEAACTHTFKSGEACGRLAGHRGKHQRGPKGEEVLHHVSILGPNLGPDTESFHIHSVGCADIKRSSLYRGQQPWNLAVPSFQHIVEEVYSDIIGDDPENNTWSDYVGEFKLFPCTGLEA